MTIPQLKARIQELETWLVKNPSSPQRGLIESDLNKIRTILNKNNG